MKAYLIEPLQQAITPIDFAADLTFIVGLLHLNDDYCVDIFPWKDHQIFASLQGHVDKKHAFWIRGYRWSLAGEALITGPSQIEPIIKRGFIRAADCTLKRDEIEQEIKWLGLSVIRPSTQNWMDWGEPRHVYGDYPKC
jgi:hypothetical protein